MQRTEVEKPPCVAKPPADSPGLARALSTWLVRDGPVHQSWREGNREGVTAVGSHPRWLQFLSITGALALVVGGTVASHVLYPKELIDPDVPAELNRVAAHYAGAEGWKFSSVEASCADWALNLFAPNGSYFAPPHYLGAVGHNATAAACANRWL